MTETQRLYNQMCEKISKFIMIRMFMYNESFDEAKGKVREIMRIVNASQI